MRRIVLPLLTASILCGALHAGDAQSSSSAHWAEIETARTIAALQSHPSFKFYADLARRASADWMQRNTALAQTRLGAGSLFYDGWIYQFREKADGRGWTWQRIRVENFIRTGARWDVLTHFNPPGADARQSVPSAVCFRKRCLVKARGSTSEPVWREFDIRKKAFLQDGFALSALDFDRVAWLHTDALVVKRRRQESSPKTGEAIVRWSRGQKAADTKALIQANGDESLNLESFVDGEHTFTVIQRESRSDRQRRREERRLGELAPMAAVREYWFVTEAGELRALPLLAEAHIVGTHRGEIVFRRTVYGGRIYGQNDDWRVGGKLWKDGSILSVPLESASSAASVRLVTAPFPGQSGHVTVNVTQGCVLVRTAEYTQLRLRCHRFGARRWQASEIPLPKIYTTALAYVLSDPLSTVALMTSETLIEPRRLLAVDTVYDRIIDLPEHRLLPFDDGQYETQRLEATSRDGTKVPYFIAHAKGMRFDGRNPAYIWHYGGWGVPELPAYGRYCAPGFWLERGGVCVVASIRGGTEMGAEWHAKGIERQHVYQDLIAVAEDLIHRKITSPRHLGMWGHAYLGGAAAATVAQMRPDLFNATVLDGNAILDLLDPAVRDDYELGSPEMPAERAFLEQTSPVQGLRQSGQAWPIFIALPSASTNPFAQMTHRYITKSGELGLPYYMYDPQSDSARNVSFEVAAYSYLAQRLMLPCASTHPAKDGLSSSTAASFRCRPRSCTE